MTCKTIAKLWRIVLLSLVFVLVFVPELFAQVSDKNAQPDVEVVQKTVDKVNVAFSQLDKLAIWQPRDPKAIKSVLDAGLGSLINAERLLENQLEQLTSPTRKHRTPQTDKKCQAIKIDLCRLMLLRGELYRHAAIATDEKDNILREKYIEQGVQAFREVRIEFPDLLLGMLGYIGESKTHRLAGNLTAAHDALTIPLQFPPHSPNPEIRRVRRLAQMELLELTLLDDPAKAIVAAEKWRKSPSLRKESIWQGRCDWLLARAYATEGSPKSISKALTLTRSKEAKKVASNFERLELLAALDKASDNTAMTNDELLQWADILAAAGREDAIEYYLRAKKDSARPIGTDRLLTLIRLYGQQKNLQGVADITEEFLTSAPVKHKLRTAVMQLRAEALMSLYRDKSVTPDIRNKLLSQLLESLMEVVTSDASPEVKRGALQEWVALSQAFLPLAERIKMMEKFSDLVKNDPWLLYTQAACKWLLLCQNPSAEVNKQKHTKIISELQDSRKLATDTNTSDIAARSVLLEARILLAKPIDDPHTALRILNDNAKLLTSDNDKAVAEQIRLSALVQLGMVDEAVRLLEKSDNKTSSPHTETLLKLSEALGQRYTSLTEKEKPVLRKQVVSLCSKALASTAGNDRSYHLAALRIAKVMLSVQAGPDAERLARMCLKSTPDKITKNSLAPSLILAEAFVVQGKLNAGAKLLDKLSTDFPKAPAVLVLQGRCELELRRPDKAAAAYRKARKLNRKGSEGWCIATLGLIRSILASEEKDNAGNIIRICRVMYPNFGNPQLRKQLLNVADLLDKTKTK